MRPKIPKTPFATRLSGSAKETRLRLYSIFQWKKRRPSVWLFAFIVAVMFGCIGLVSCQEKEDNLWLGLNARVVEIDTEQMILYVQDIDESAAVFGQRCALDCKQAAEEKKLIFVNYETSDLIDIPFAEFRVGDTLIISMYNSQKEGAKDAAALAVQVQLGTQRKLNTVEGSTASIQSVIRVDPAEDIVIKTGKTFYHVSEDEITFSITNNRDKPWYYGQDFVIEVLEGENWYPAGRFLGEVPAVETLLNPKYTIISTLKFKDYFESVRPGHYRVVVNPNYGEWASAEFDIWAESEGSIVGQWETEASVIGTKAVSPAGEGRYILTFMEDRSGKEEIIFDGIWEERSFTYSMTEDEIQIQFDSGNLWTFPYHLEGDHLTLTQNHRETVYERVPFEQIEKEKPSFGVDANIQQIGGPILWYYQQKYSENPVYWAVDQPDLPEENDYRLGPMTYVDEMDLNENVAVIYNMCVNRCAVSDGEIDWAAVAPTYLALLYDADGTFRQVLGEVAADDTENTAKEIVQQVLSSHCQDGENIGLLVTTSSATKRIGEDIRNCIHGAVGNVDVRYQYQTYVERRCTLCGYDASYGEEPWWSQWYCGA